MEGKVYEAIGWVEWMRPAILLLLGVLLGWLFERIVLKKIRRIAEKTRWMGDEIIIRSVRGFMFLWIVIAGIYGAFITMPIGVAPAYTQVFNKVLLAILILTATIALARICVGLLNAYARSIEAALPAASIINNLTYIVVGVVGVLIVLQSLGISITPILTALGVGGLAVALALQDTLSNLFAGLQIILAKQLKPGDYIKLDSGEEGYVTDISWRNTTIRQLPNNIIVIPNSKLANAIVTNFNQPEAEMSVLVGVGVDYSSDLEKVERVTIEVAKEALKEIPGGVETFQPFIRYHSFDDSSINFNVILRVKSYVDQYLVKHEFIKRLHRRFEEEGIVIPFPIRTVYLEGGSRNAEIPKEAQDAREKPEMLFPSDIEEHGED